MYRTLHILFFLAIVGVTGPVSGADGAAVGRFALVIGSNRGGDGRAELKYAVSDARTFASVLTEMGGVDPAHCIEVVNPDRAQLTSRFDGFRKLVEQEGRGVRSEAIIYYSGHADADGVILGDEWYTYGEIRNRLKETGADVRIAVIDACASGSMTREKGGKHRQPFLYDVSSSMEGYAFLTSSASDEVSQESDAIRSSFFTHYLVSGMRGPADANGDGKVTLNEAYAFAYDATLQRTAVTKAGPQHAAYDIRLKGSGDLVLTDMRSARARLRLDDPVQGHVFVNDSEGRLLVELVKTAGKPMSVGLDAGTYRVLVNNGARTASAMVTLENNRTVIVDGSAMTPVARDGAAVRGTVADSGEPVGYSHIPFTLSLLPAFGIGSSSTKTMTNVSISALGGRTDKLYGVDISGGVSYVPETVNGVQITGAAAFSGRVNGAQFTGGVNMAGGTLHGIQISGGLNTASAAAVAVQITGGINSTGAFSGGAQISGGGNQVDGNADVLQISGGYNVVGNAFHGAQITGGFNTSGGEMHGTQISGGFNVAGASSSGSMITGGVNYTNGDFSGGAISGGANFCNNLHGFQITGGSNTSCHEMHGVQISGGANIAGAASSGVLVTGGANYTNGNFGGVAVSGFVNRCGDLHGCQITGGINIASSCSGVQIAPINACRTLRGVQIGVINFCDTIIGIPIGLMTFSTKLRPHYRIFLDEAGFMQAALRTGSDRVYSLLLAGAVPRVANVQYTYGGGMGVRWPLGFGYAGLESVINNVRTRSVKDSESIHLRTAFVYSSEKLGPVAVWGGPSFNVGITWDKGNERYSRFPVSYGKYGHSWVGMWPGFMIGAEL